MTFLSTSSATVSQIYPKMIGSAGPVKKVAAAEYQVFCSSSVLCAGLKGSEIKCELCGFTGGALKPTEEKGKWAHVQCGLWLPETYIKDVRVVCVSGVCLFVSVYSRAQMEPVAGCHLVNKDRENKLTCYLCKNPSDATPLTSPRAKSWVWQVVTASSAVTSGASLHFILIVQ